MNICVFTGSSIGADPAYRAAAEALGREMAARGIGLVYGGASVGLMGAVADAALAAGGAVTGILPQAIADREIAHPGLTQLEIVPSMHARKARMNELSQGFIALPGGIGTLEETFEVWTWAQLGIHTKALGLLNVAGFYDGLEVFLDHLVTQSFVRPVHRGMLLSTTDPAQLLDQIVQAESPLADKWIDS
ncbi:MAG: TIGR00730 family Rossman fold protein [Pseudomonadota bacterium]